ncbi:hypothetical protein B382_21255 [Stutzerimonas stutzeri B1SMN1]|nr:hypothetical protein B382_21255 [Stutzerimonas stutzeri B1SMN1]
MKVEQVRELADRDAIAKYLANIVPALEIGPRKNGFDFRVGYERVPTKPKAYKAWLEKRLASELAELERDRAEYEEHRLGGLDALTDIDLLYAAGNATEAAKTAMETIFYLKSAHISAGLSKIEGIRQELKRLDGEADQEQVNNLADQVPDGFEMVDVVLPARQAFIVKKWAEAAQARIKTKGKK